MLELVKYVVEQFAEHKDAIEYKEAVMSTHPKLFYLYANL